MECKNSQFNQFSVCKFSFVNIRVDEDFDWMLLTEKKLQLSNDDDWLGRSFYNCKISLFILFTFKAIHTI